VRCLVVSRAFVGRPDQCPKCLAVETTPLPPVNSYRCPRWLVTCSQDLLRCSFNYERHKNDVRDKFSLFLRRSQYTSELSTSFCAWHSAWMFATIGLMASSLPIVPPFRVHNPLSLLARMLKAKVCT
jgi:hypothetical protein